MLKQPHHEQQEGNYQQATIEHENAIGEPLWQAENVDDLTVIRF
ncbi:hypothetical protein [Coleofasciculus sp. H7-2]